MHAEILARRDEITSRYLGGENLDELAASQGVCRASVRRWLRAWGVNKRPTVGRPWCAVDHRDALLRGYAAGRSQQSLALEFGVTQTVVGDWLRRWGAVTRRTGPPRKHTLNEAAFALPWTQEKAYWFGFLLADGNIADPGGTPRVLQLALANRDRGHIARFVEFLDYTGPTSSRAATGATGLGVSSAVLCRQLGILGMHPRKSGTHGTPDMPADMKSHMYRGYFDGDGALYQWKRQPTLWKFEVVSSLPFIQDFQKWLFEVAAVPHTKLFRRGPVWSVRSSGNQITARICQQLYRDAAIYLPRKYEKWLELSKQLCLSTVAA